MAEELNPQGSSQSTPSASAGAEPNAAGKPSEPVAQPGMTTSQSSDYYNKTQQLAQQRREHDAEKAAFAAEKAAWERQRLGYQPNGYPPNQGYGQPQGYQAAPQPPQIPQLQVDPQVYAGLVEQFGVEGANAQVRLLQHSAASVQQQLAVAQRQAEYAQITALEQSLNSKGQGLFGEEWKVKGPEVMDFVREYGVPLEKAWYAINGAAVRQAGMDAAYQNQQVKQEANVNQSNVQPAATQAGNFSAFGDAFEAAWGQHNS